MTTNIILKDQLVCFRKLAVTKWFEDEKYALCRKIMACLVAEAIAEGQTIEEATLNGPHHQTVNAVDQSTGYLVFIEPNQEVRPIDRVEIKEL